MNEIAAQPAVFLTMVYGGILAGLWYDVLKLFRTRFGGRFVTTLCDVLFVAGCLGLLGTALFWATGGSMRPYTIAGFVSGGVLERMSFGKVLFSPLLRKVPPGKTR